MRRRSNHQLAEGAECQGRGKGKEERWNRRTIIMHHVLFPCGCSNWQIHSLELGCSNYLINLIFTLHIDLSVDFSSLY